MLPQQLPDHELLRRYLTGALTAPEEAELERRARSDEALAEALLGIRAVPEEDHTARVASLLKRARTQVPQKVEKAGPLRPASPGYLRWAGVAAAVLLIATAIFLLPPGFGTDGDGSVAMAEPLPAPTTDYEAREELPLLSEADESVAEAPPAPAPSTSPAPASAPARISLPARAEAATPTPEATARARAERTQRATAARRQAPAQARARAEAETAAEAEALEDATVPVTEAAAPPALLTDRQLTPPVSYDRATTSLTGGNTTFLEGVVTNENGVAIENALVRLPGQALGETTDSSGYFRMPANGIARLLEVSHPDYEDEEVELSRTASDVQISLDRKPFRKESSLYKPTVGTTIVPGSFLPGYAVPAEGFGTLRKRLIADRPANLPAGKYKFSFVVNLDGTLTDFEFRGRPDRAVMDYIGRTLVQTSEWTIRDAEEPVRVYFKVAW